MSDISIKERYINAKRALFKKAYSTLNDKQAEAVFTTEGPLLVLAGAGSGKTTVLVRRVAFIVKYGNAYFDDTVPNGIPDYFVAQLEEFARDESLPEKQLLDCLDMFKNAPAKPWQVLSITFTNKAANEMKERLSAILGEEALEIWAGTFHSICVRILRRHIERLGYDKSFTIYDTDDTKKLMNSCMKELNIDDKILPVKSVLSAIGRAKDKLIGYREYEASLGGKIDVREKNKARLYELYEKKKAAANALDFDDIIMFTVKLLSENEDIRESYCSRFKYVLVDEYQDTNMAQFYLVRLLCSDAENIMVVGDDDQSIYKFRGATIENILSFDSCFKAAKVIRLEQNYRSKAMILDSANAIISHNTGRKGKTLWTKNDRGEKIEVRECDNAISEASFITDTIGELTRDGTHTFRDFAVLYRLNAQSNALETTFSKSGFPYRILGGLRFYERKEVKDIISYLCVVANPGDMIRLRRIINVPKRGIGDASVSSLEAICAKEGKSPLEVMRHAGVYPDLSRCAVRLREFATLIEDFRDTADNESLPVLMEKVIEKSGYRRMLVEAGEEEKERLQNIEELVSNAVSYTENNDEASLSGFLEEVALVADVDNYDENADAVTLMTIHSSKGLEFPVVFLPGLEEGIFPGTQSAMEIADLEEERRLAYVAVTRAKERLFITHCRSRLLYGKTSCNPKSRFLKEIPDDFCNVVALTPNDAFDFDSSFDHRFNPFGKRESDDRDSAFGKRFFGSSDKNESPSFPFGRPSGIASSPTQAKPTATPQVEFSVGDSVIHPTFGEGIVLVSEKIGSDMRYEVAFENVGTKKMMGKFAKMKKKTD